MFFMLKVELARAYAPNLTDGAALNRLASWIAYNPQLSMELDKTYYKRTQKAYTPKQVELIYEFLGEP